MNKNYLCRERNIHYQVIILLIVLFLGACVSVKQPDLKIKDEKVVLLVKEGARLYDKGKYREALERLSQAEKQARLSQDKTEIADILFKGGFALSEKKLFTTALSYYERSLGIYRVSDNKPALARNYDYIGKVYSDIGKYEEGFGILKKPSRCKKN